MRRKVWVFQCSTLRRRGCFQYWFFPVLSVVFSNMFIRIKIENFAGVPYFVCKNKSWGYLLSTVSEHGSARQQRWAGTTAVFLFSATVIRIPWCSSARTWQGIFYQGEYSSEQKLWWVCSGFYENLQALLVLLCILDRTIITKQLAIQCSFRRVDLPKNQKGRDP